MKEIGLHGRGGQGVIVAGEILANAYFYEGYESQFMPSYGAERRGSPSNAYIRIDKTKIFNRYPIYIPNMVIVFNMSLIDNIKVKQNGTALLNTASPLKVKQNNIRIFIVDGNKIALSLKLGTEAMPIVNSALLGAFCKVSSDYSFENLSKAIETKIGKNAGINIEAAQIAYDFVREI